MHYFIEGLIIGFSVAAPVGPIGVLTIRRTLTEGQFSGFVTGMGAAMADTVYGLIAGFGLTAVSDFLEAQQFWMKLIGGIFLLYLGIKSFRSKPPVNKEQAAPGYKGLFGNFISTFFLTVTNPATIFSFLAIFSGFGIRPAEGGYGSATTLVTGVFLGSALWWLILSTVVSFLRHKITPEGLTWINRISGLLILFFGLWAFYSLIP